MKRFHAFGLILVCAALLSVPVFAGDGDKYELGKKVADFTLKDLNGKEHSLYGLLAKEDVKGVVVMFTSIQCPVSNACDDRYTEMAAAYAKKGIMFVGINSNKTEPVEKIAAAHKERGYNFPILKDWDNKIADRFDAQYTPHAYLVGEDGTLLYRGRIDDNHRNASKVTEHTLDMVVGEYTAGKKLSVSDTKSTGCTIKRVN